VIVHSPQVERDTMLLDTVTGRTWSRVEISDVRGTPPAWEPVPQLNEPADFEALLKRRGENPDQSPAEKQQ
jgi:hypothetical protein